VGKTKVINSVVMHASSSVEDFDIFISDVIEVYQLIVHTQLMPIRKIVKIP